VPQDRIFRLSGGSIETLPASQPPSPPDGRPAKGARSGDG
jgi:hypothetical protein